MMTSEQKRELAFTLIRDAINRDPAWFKDPIPLVQRAFNIVNEIAKREVPA